MLKLLLYREMLAFKNKKDKLIVVYDYDELVASKFATTLVQRGYDNVFMLSGGVRITQVIEINLIFSLYSNNHTIIIFRQSFQNV